MNTNYDPNKIWPEKKSAVIWPAMFFEPPEKITAGKKRYSRLTDGWNKSQITICHVKIRTHQLWLEKIMTGKKVRYSSVMSKYKHHQSHFNLRKFLLGFFIFRNNEIQTFCCCVSLSCFVWIYNHTVTIVSQKYQELCVISETIVIGFFCFRETTC